MVERHPVNDYAHFCLGRALSLTGHADRARRHLALASNLRPERRDYSDLSGSRLASQASLRALVQRVCAASVAVERRGRAIGQGLLVLLGVGPGTTPRRWPTGSPTRSARSGSSTTPTGA